MQLAQNLKKIDALQTEISMYRPLKKAELAQLKEYFRIGLTYTSNNFEGNSLTETETKIIIEDGLTIGGKSIREHLEVLGHSEAYDLLFELAKNKQITESALLNLHKLFYYRIDSAHAGNYRTTRVFITGTSFIPPTPTRVPALMKAFIKKNRTIKKDQHPVEYAALLHLKLVEIHPFVDGNGRTARLLMNLALMQAGYPITTIPPICKREYIQAIRAAQTGTKATEPFVNFIAAMVIESQKDYLRLLKALHEK